MIIKDYIVSDGILTANIGGKTIKALVDVRNKMKNIIGFTADWMTAALEENCGYVGVITDHDTEAQIFDINEAEQVEDECEGSLTYIFGIR